MPDAEYLEEKGFIKLSSYFEKKLLTFSLKSLYNLEGSKKEARCNDKIPPTEVPPNTSIFYILSSMT